MVVRPIALVFGFVFFFYTVSVACWFAAQGLGLFLSGMLENVTVGPGAFLATTTVILTTLFMIVRYSVSLITHLAEELPRWIGGMGNNMGDSQAAQQGAGDLQGRGAGLSQGAERVGTSVQRDLAESGQGRANQAKAESEAMVNAMKTGIDTSTETGRATAREAQAFAKKTDTGVGGNSAGYGFTDDKGIARWGQGAESAAAENIAAKSGGGGASPMGNATKGAPPDKGGTGGRV